MTVTIEVLDIFKAAGERKTQNSVPVSEVVFTCNGKIVNVPKDVLEDWELLGLTNLDFVANYDWWGD